jgi:transposase
MIAPNRENPSKSQDGGPPRRYERRRLRERLFVGLQWFRRLATRYEFHADNFLGMAHPGCMKSS